MSQKLARPRFHIFKCLLAFLLVFQWHIAWAVDYTWNGADATWEDGTNWTGDGGYPDGSDDKALFNGTSNQAVTTPAAGVTIGFLEMTSGHTGNVTLGGNLTLSKAGGLDGTMLMNGGTFTTSSNNYSVDVAGSLTSQSFHTLVLNNSSVNVERDVFISGNSQTFVQGTSTVTLDATDATQQVTTSTSKNFYNMVLNNTATGDASDDIKFISDVRVDNDLTLTDGEIRGTAGGLTLYSFSVQGDFTVGSSASFGNGVTITFNGSTDQTFTNGQSGTIPWHVTINNTGAAGNDDVTLVGDINITKNLTITDGDFNTGINDLTVSQNFIVNPSGSLTMGTGTVYLTGSGNYNLTTNGSSIYNLWIWKSAAGNTITFTDDLSLGYGGLAFIQGTLAAGTASPTLTVKGNWGDTSTGKFTPRFGTVVFDGTASSPVTPDIAGGTSFWNVTVNKTSGTDSDDDVILNGDMDINGALTITDGELEFPTVDLNIQGDFTVAAGGSFNAGNASTVTFDGTQSTTLTSNGQAFHTIAVSKSSVTDSLDDVILADNFDFYTIAISDGELDAETNNVDITISGNWTMFANGSFTSGSTTETVTFDGTATQSIGGGGLNGVGVDDPTKDFNHVTISSSQVNITGSETEINGSLTIESGNLLYLNALNSRLDLYGDLSNNGTIRVRGDHGISLANGNDVDSGTWEYVGDGDTAADTYTIQNFDTSGKDYYNLTINATDNAGVDDFQLGASLEVAGDFIQYGGEFDTTASNYDVTVDGTFVLAQTDANDDFAANGSTITLTGDMTVVNSLAIFEAGTSTVSLNGASQSMTANSLTFNTLSLDNAGGGAVTFVDDFTAANLTFTAPGATYTFNAGDTYTITGALSSSGMQDTNEVTLQSDSAGTDFVFNVSSAGNLTHVNVNDSEAATSNINCFSCTDGGTNDDNADASLWVFRPLRGSMIMINSN